MLLRSTALRLMHLWCHRMMMKSMRRLHRPSCMLQLIVASNDTSVPSGNEHSCSE